MKLNLMQKTVLEGHKQFKTFICVTARRMGKTYLINMLTEKYLKEGKKVLRIGSGLNQTYNTSFLGKDFDIRLFDEPCTIKDFRNSYFFTYSKKTLIIGSPDIHSEKHLSLFKFLYETYPSACFPYTTEYLDDDFILEIKSLCTKEVFNSEFLCEWKK